MHCRCHPSCPSPSFHLPPQPVANVLSRPRGRHHRSLVPHHQEPVQVAQDALSKVGQEYGAAADLAPEGAGCLSVCPRSPKPGSSSENAHIRPDPDPKTGRFPPGSVTSWHHHVHSAGFCGLISASLNNLKALPTPASTAAHLTELHDQTALLLMGST